MRKFLMSTRFNKQSPQDFGITYKDGKYICDEDGSEWMLCALYDLGWGEENGFYRVPLGSFEELIAMVLSDEDPEDSYGAAAMIQKVYAVELKAYLLHLIQQKIRFRDRKKLRKLNRFFCLHRGRNLTFQVGMPVADIEKANNDWQRIAAFFKNHE